MRRINATLVYNPPKKGYRGTYNHMSGKHLQWNINELSGRHNFRYNMSFSKWRKSL